MTDGKISQAVHSLFSNKTLIVTVGDANDDVSMGKLAVGKIERANAVPVQCRIG
jgi:hypothetical protein